MKRTRKETTEGHSPLALLTGNAKGEVAQRSEPETSKKLDEVDLALYRADLKQRLHRELRQAYERVRKEEGLTYAELAKRLKVNRSVITRRFKGQANLTLDVLSDMFRALGARLDFKVRLHEDMVKQRETATYSTGLFCGSFDTGGQLSKMLKTIEAFLQTSPDQDHSFARPQPTNVSFRYWTHSPESMSHDLCVFGHLDEAEPAHTSGGDWIHSAPAPDIQIITGTKPEDTRTRHVWHKHTTVN